MVMHFDYCMHLLSIVALVSMKVVFAQGFFFAPLLRRCSSTVANSTLVSTLCNTTPLHKYGYKRGRVRKTSNECTDCFRLSVFYLLFCFRTHKKNISRFNLYFLTHKYDTNGNCHSAGQSIIYCELLICADVDMGSAESSMSVLCC